jgi:integrase
VALTDTAIRNKKAGPKPVKLFDQGGLFVIITPNGGKWWRFKYKYQGKEKLLSLGTYPDTPLTAARRKRDDARKLLAAGTDPSAHRKAEKAELHSDNSFEGVAREWLVKNAPKWSQAQPERILRRFELYIFPALGKRPAGQISAPELLKALRPLEEQGIIETAHKTMQSCGQVFRYAIATGRAERDPAADLRGALSPIVVTHHASITDTRQVGQLLRDITAYDGSFITRCALRFAPLTFVRPGEMRRAEWSEFDFEKREWRIPAERMKMREPHIVPLSKQAIAILRELQALTGAGRYLFPGARTITRPMSENTVNAALRRLGYASDTMTGHGFRSMASTILNEQGTWHRDAIERQLAHGERDAVRAAYNYAEHLPERRRMMQAWADYLEQLEKGAKVLKLGAA